MVRTPGASSEYTGPEPYESNDIKLLRLEIESGLLDMRKMTEVRSECEILEWKSVKKPPTAVKEKSRKRRNVRKAADMSDTDSVLSDTGMFSARKWLKKYGLVAQKLTIMDALAPTVITQHPKYVDALKKKVHAKVGFIEEGNQQFNLLLVATLDIMSKGMKQAFDLLMTIYYGIHFI